MPAGVPQFDYLRPLFPSLDFNGNPLTPIQRDLLQRANQYPTVINRIANLNTALMSAAFAALYHGLPALRMYAGLAAKRLNEYKNKDVGSLPEEEAKKFLKIAYIAQGLENASQTEKKDSFLNEKINEIIELAKLNDEMITEVQQSATEYCKSISPDAPGETPKIIPVLRF